MYTNVAYLGKKHEDIVDKSKPLIITAVGYYRVHTSRNIQTERPNGRGDYQLLYIAAGCVHFSFNGVDKIIPKGNMVLFRPGETQMYYLYASDKPETYWVHFTGSDVERLLNYCQIPWEENVFFTGTSPDYQWLFRQMIQELHLQHTNYEDLLNINLRHILLIINRYLKEENAVGTEMLDEVERAIHYFNEHYNQPIIIEDYAKERAITANWFIQCFKRITKFTPMQYILSLRMTNARNLIDTTTYNMKQIAAAVGYDNSMYFSRVFKKHTGMTPTEYKHRSKRRMD